MRERKRERIKRNEQGRKNGICRVAYNYSARNIGGACRNDKRVQKWSGRGIYCIYAGAFESYMRCSGADNRIYCVSGDEKKEEIKKADRRRVLMNALYVSFVFIKA